MLSNKSHCINRSVHFSVVRCSLQHAIKSVLMLTIPTSVTLLSLPPEILHRIFDNIDTQTILLSVRSVCRQLYSIVNTYNRFKLKAVSSGQLVNISHGFATENVFSLTVYDGSDGFEMEDVSSLIDCLQRFTHLRSLTLFGVFDDELDILLSYLITTHLTKFTISFKAWSRGSSVSQSSHYVFSPQLNSNDSNDVGFSIQYMLQYLSINYCTIEQLSQFLHHFPCLRTLNISSMQTRQIEQVSPIPLTRTLLSKLETVYLNCSKMDTNELELLFSCMPSVRRLKLHGRHESVNFLFDGSYWKQMISRCLPQLQEFKFDFITRSFNENDEIESIIDSFRTSFWLEEKCWFVSCTFRGYFPKARIILRSPPIVITDIDYSEKGFTFSLFNTPPSMNDRVVINSVRRVKLNLASMLYSAAATQV